MGGGSMRNTRKIKQLLSRDKRCCWTGRRSRRGDSWTNERKTRPRGISVLKKCAQNPKKWLESDMTDDNVDVGVKASGLAPGSEESVLDCSLGAKVPSMAPSLALRGQVGYHGVGVNAMVRRPLD
ncbi:hypothetical protein Syun_008239 [Stephania yunnanensis]|uniref:Uncharacterized protein n=1 Tax=Stephania yunnanensis TaxID=152371 RepID=A0AAP0L1E9_9MAGN